MWIDAHNHLQDPSLAEVDFSKLSLRAAVVNGTMPGDWARVAELAKKHPWVYPAYGLHPWFLREKKSNWMAELTKRLEDPRASIGEIGLDYGMKNADRSEQKTIFRAQLELAAQWNRPASIHCVRASGDLLEVLGSVPLPKRGFLLHAFSGSWETVRECLKLGAFFSFSGAFLQERNTRIQAVFQEIPLDRVLVETDAPAMLPPVERRVALLDSGANHPANIATAYQGLADLRKMEVSVLHEAVGKNFLTLFGP